MASSRSLVFSRRSVFKSFAFLFVQLILLTRNGITANGTGNCPENWTNVVSLDDQWRSVYNDKNSAKEECDEGKLKENTWYSFSQTEENEIPTHCVKNHACGTRVGMWLDLSGQKLTSDGSIIQAHLCGAYNVLGKYDCCVLRTPVSVANCSGKFIYKLHKPIDRCPVAVCTIKVREDLNDTVKAVAGAQYTEDTTTGSTNLLVTESSTSGLETSETSSLGVTTDAASSDYTANTATSDGNTIETSSVDVTSEVSSDGTIETAPVDVTSQTSSVDGSTQVSSDETSVQPTSERISYGTTNEASTDGAIPSGSSEGLISAASSDGTTNEASTDGAIPSGSSEGLISAASSDGTTNEASTDGDIPSGSSEGLISAASSDGTTIEATNEVTTNEMTSDFEMTQPSSVSSFSSNEISDLVTAEESTTDHVTSTREASGTSYESTESPSDSSSTTAASLSDESHSTDRIAEESSESTSEMTSESTFSMSTDDNAPQPLMQQSTTETETSTSDTPPPMPAELTDKTSPETSVSTQRDSDVTEDVTFPVETSKQASESPLPVSADETSTDIPEMSSTHEASTGTDLLTTDSIPLSSEASSADQSGDAKAPETEATSAVISTSTTTTQEVIASIQTTRASTEKSTTSIHDVIMVEHIKLIFRSPAPNVTINLVHLMPSFFRRAENDSTQRNKKAFFNMTIPSEYYETCSLNRTCVMVKIISSGGEGITSVFDRLDLTAFLDHNSKSSYKLIGYCRISENCEHKEETPKVQASQTSFEKNAPIFITVIALCVICLAVIIVGVICTRVWRRGTYHAGDNIERVGTAEDDHHHVTATPSPFTDEQIMKDELVTCKPDIAEKGSSNGSALDGGESTWVIPLDDAPAPELQPINCEDTKL